MPSVSATVAEIEGATDTDFSGQRWVKGTVLDPYRNSQETMVLPTGSARRALVASRLTILAVAAS